jgi:hypothetical protein
LPSYGVEKLVAFHGELKNDVRNEFHPNWWQIVLQKIEKSASKSYGHETPKIEEFSS